jgi:hypothetical protein
MGFSMEILLFSVEVRNMAVLLRRRKVPQLGDRHPHGSGKGKGIQRRETTAKVGGRGKIIVLQPSRKN